MKSNAEVPQMAHISMSAIKAAELEIAANHLRALRHCDAPIGIFIQKAIDSEVRHVNDMTHEKAPLETSVDRRDS